MRVSVDTSRCEAHGECTLAAPAVFELDEEALVSRVLVEEPSEDLHAAVHEAQVLCPVRAVLVED